MPRAPKIVREATASREFVKRNHENINWVEAKAYPSAQGNKWCLSIRGMDRIGRNPFDVANAGRHEPIAGFLGCGHSKQAVMRAKKAFERGIQSKLLARLIARQR